MIRGVNRRVIEIKKCNSDYFDRAFLVVKDEKSDVDETVLNCSAQLYLSSLKGQKKKKGQPFIKALSYVLCLVLGFAAAFIVR